jgi:beta-aspartyl-peptidase (threonine type)
MEYKGLSLKDACDYVVMDKLKNMGGEGGLIAVDSAGNVELPFNSEGMYRAWCNEAGEGEVAIFG